MKLKITTFVIVLCVLVSFSLSKVKTFAEGPSAALSLVLSRSVLNIGKTFSVTLYANANVNITSFNLVLGYDDTKLSVLDKTGSSYLEGNGSVKVDKSTKIPDSFSLQGARDGKEIVITAYDTTLESPAVLSGNTPIIIVYFKVKDNAPADTNVAFSITSSKFNILSDLEPIPIALEYPAPKSAEIGPRLDTNTYLTSIKPSTGTLTPAFSKSVYNYTVDVPEETDSVSFTAAAESTKAKSVATSGGTSLNFGANTVTIKVTAEDPDFTRVYTITVNRASPPTATPSPSPSPSPEPTEEVSEESSEVSSEDSSVISEDVTPTPPVIGPDDPGSAGPWKTAVIVLSVLCALLTGTTVWLAVDKVRNSDKIVKVRRV